MNEKTPKADAAVMVRGIGIVPVGLPGAARDHIQECIVGDADAKLTCMNLFILIITVYCIIIIIIIIILLLHIIYNYVSLLAPVYYQRMSTLCL